MKRSEESKDRINLSEVHLKMRTRELRLSGPLYKKRRKFRELFSLTCLVGPRQRGEEGKKTGLPRRHWTTSDTICRQSKTSGPQQQKLQQEAKNRYGRVLVGKTSVLPNAGQRGDKTSQQKLQQEANEPIWQSPIRQDISITKRW